MYNFVVHSNESACRKSGRLGLDQVEWQTAVGSTILAAHTVKTSIFQLRLRPTGGGMTLVSTETAACIKGITLCICPIRPI